MEKQQLQETETRRARFPKISPSIGSGKIVRLLFSSHPSIIRTSLRTSSFRIVWVKEWWKHLRRSVLPALPDNCARQGSCTQTPSAGCADCSGGGCSASSYEYVGSIAQFRFLSNSLAEDARTFVVFLRLQQLPSRWTIRLCLCASSVDASWRRHSGEQRGCLLRSTP